MGTSAGLETQEKEQSGKKVKANIDKVQGADIHEHIESSFYNSHFTDEGM